MRLCENCGNGFVIDTKASRQFKNCRAIGMFFCPSCRTSRGRVASGDARAAAPFAPRMLDAMTMP